MTDQEQFDTGAAPRAPEGQLLLDLDGFEGPIDVLLALARDQKVDITQISILELADQYLAFITRARRVRLELAADYLVMAAWLAYLKSRLLLPEVEDDEQPSGQQMAEALAFQLRRLEAIQEAGTRLMARPLVGRDVFRRGRPEEAEIITENIFAANLYGLLKGYGDLRARLADSTLYIAPLDYYSVEEALERLQDLLGETPDWELLSKFLPQGLKKGPLMRSAVATTFAALLEAVREGRAELRQTVPFGPLYLRKAREKK